MATKRSRPEVIPLAVTGGSSGGGGGDSAWTEDKVDLNLSRLGLIANNTSGGGGGGDAWSQANIDKLFDILRGPQPPPTAKIRINNVSIETNWVGSFSYLGGFIAANFTYLPPSSSATVEGDVIYIKKEEYATPNPYVIRVQRGGAPLVIDGEAWYQENKVDLIPEQVTSFHFSVNILLDDGSMGVIYSRGGGSFGSVIPFPLDITYTIDSSIAYVPTY